MIRTSFTLSDCTREAAFTLLELIITISIVAALVTAVLPRIGKKGNEVRALVRKFSTISHDLKSRARLNNATYRLVLDLGEETVSADKRKYQYWVEKAAGQVLNNYDPKNPPKLPKPDDKPKPEDDAPASPFSPDPKVMKRPEILPDGMSFESVELASAQDPIKSGLVYIHYFPTGFADEAAIHILFQEKLKWTLAIEPLTGRVDILEKSVPLKDLQAK